MTPDELEALILEADDAWPLQRALERMDEKERARLSPDAQKIFNQLFKNKANAGASDRLKRFISRRSGDAWQHWNAKETRRATLALFGLCPISVLKKRDVFVGLQEESVFDRIIRDRRPEWLDDWIAFRLESEATQVDFPTLRGWIKDGVCAKPEVDGYYRMSAAHLMRTGFYHRNEVVPPISVQLLADPGLLDDVEGLFRVENIAFNTNSWLRKGAAADYESWTDALVKLSNEGHIDREYLLGLALQGLTRDLKQNQLSGFHGFYKRMGPTAEELLRHQQDYVALLCHPVGHVVKFAIDVLGEVEKKKGLDTALVLREVQAVFTSEGKGNAIAALKLIKRIITRQKASDPASLDAVCEALRHGHPEVQSLALDILEAYTGRLGESPLAALRDLESFVSASNRSRVSTLLAASPGAPAGSRDPAQAPETTSASADLQPQVRETHSYRTISDDISYQRILFPEDALAPIASIDELIDAIFHAAEVVDSPDEIERILDGISRFAADRPADFDARVSPLLHRLGKGPPGINSMVVGIGGVGLALSDLVQTWLTGRLHRTASKYVDHYGLEDAFSPVIQNVRSIAERVARGQSQILLSAPTHKGGWIDPLVWIERLRAAQHPGDVTETVDFHLSLLRLSPDNRNAALGQAAALNPSKRRLIQFALGGDEFPTKEDRKNYAAWITAARCRAPLKDWSAEFTALELDDKWPDSIKPASYDWRSSHTPGQYENLRWKTPELSVSVSCAGERLPDQRDSGLLARVVQSIGGRISTDWTLLPTAALNRQMETKPSWMGEMGTTWVAQWLAYIWPQHPAAAYIKGATKLVQRMDEDSSSWTPGIGYLQGLFQKNRPWLEPGHLLLCIGLAGKDADVKGLAVDALIEGIDGRLFDPALFARTLARLCQGEWVKFNRVGDGLMQVVQVSNLHAAIVSETLQACIPHLDLQQKNAFRLLEVLVEAQAVVDLPLEGATRDALRNLKGSGKAAKLAKQLLSA